MGGVVLGGAGVSGWKKPIPPAKLGIPVLLRVLPELQKKTINDTTISLAAPQCWQVSQCRELASL